MNEHMHEWMTRYSSFGSSEGVTWFCTILGCSEKLAWPEVWRRVNAIERLSAETALQIETWLPLAGLSGKDHPERQSLRAYAAALEGE